MSATPLTPAWKAFLAVVMTLSLLSLVQALPSGPTLNYVSQSESPAASSTQDTNSSHTGGKIMVMNLDVVQQDSHWKAYVGNVSGSLKLEDADQYSIYEWSITEVTGEVYATRGSSVNWTTVVCANISHVNAEQLAMNHTATYTPDDNITNTFNEPNNHTNFLAGPSIIAENSCNFTTQTYVNDSIQAASSADVFEELLLYDGTNVIYTTIMESNEYGFHTNRTYDYQILVAEKGEPGFTGSATSYYFYVELL